MPIKIKKPKYGIPPRKPAKKGSNILDASMTSELKTELSRQAITPIEKLGVNLMYDNRKMGVGGSVTPIKNLAAIGKFGAYHSGTKNIAYSVAHSPKHSALKSEIAQRKAGKNELGDKHGMVDKPLKDQPMLSTWTQRDAAGQADTLIHEGVHKAMHHVQGGDWWGENRKGKTVGGIMDHSVINLLNREKTGRGLSIAGYDILPKDRAKLSRFKRNVPEKGMKWLGALAEGDKWQYWNNRTQHFTSGLQQKASKMLAKHGLEDPSTFVDRSEEYAKSAKKINALTDMRRILMRQSMAKPIVTARKINWGT